MDSKATEYTQSTWQIENGTFIYALDPNSGVNRFDCNMNPGFTASGRTSIAELEGNARLAVAAKESYAKHSTDPVEAAESDLLGEALENVHNMIQRYEEATGERKHKDCGCSYCKARALLAKAKEAKP